MHAGQTATHITRITANAFWQALHHGAVWQLDAQAVGCQAAGVSHGKVCEQRTLPSAIRAMRSALPSIVMLQSLGALAW